MTRLRTNDVEINYEETGAGEPVVLVHGSWSDHHNWDMVLGSLADSFHVVAYDRRGNGGSESVHGLRSDHEDDLAALVASLDLGPAHLVGTSFGGSIALGLASRRPDLIAGVVVHEPPLLGLIADEPGVDRLLAPFAETVGTVVELARDGDHAGAAELFVERVAFEPGTWPQLPESIRATMVAGAPAFVAEQSDPGWAVIDTDALAELRRPVLLSQGDESPPWFRMIVGTLEGVIEGSRVHTYAGAGHAPHLTHPGDYARVVSGFLSGESRSTA
jgi:pimeloyl-ACP methyl ester carboxylesterase